MVPKNIPEFLIDGIAWIGHLRGKFSRLSSIERVITAFKHKEPDRVPVTPLICSAGRQLKGIAFPEFSQDAEKAADAYCAGLEIVGGDIIVLLYDLSVEAADFGQQMVYPQHSTPHPDYTKPFIKDVSDYRKLTPIELKDAKRMQVHIKLCQLMVERIGLKALVVGFVFGPLGVLNMMRGAERFFKDCVNYPTDVMAALDTITEVLVEYVKAQCRKGVLALCIDTLFASYNGLPKPLWEKIEGPFVREISNTIKKEGAYVGVHNCGQGLYFDAQIRAMEPSFISFAHLPDDCATPQQLKSTYGDQVVLVGNIPTQMLHYASPYQVMEECRRQIDVYGDGGGYVLAPGCEYPPNISLMNAIAIVKAAEKWG